MLILYRIFTALVSFLLPPVAFVRGGKLREFARGRSKGIPVSPLAPAGGRRYWFHCASLGEFEQARPLMEKLKEDRNNSIVITFFSPSGYTRCFDYDLADEVLYLPYDTPSNARRLLDHIRPDAVIFIKYELWYFHLREVQKRAIPLYLVSAVFRESHFLFRFYGQPWFSLLKGFAKIFLQDKNSLGLLEKKGLKNIELSGDTRYDRVKANALRVKENELIRRFRGNGKLLVLGSSWPAEEELLEQALKKNMPEGLRIMIAPHDISEGHVLGIMKRFEDLNPCRYTGPEHTEGSRLLVLDTIGHLASAYCYADMALIGGGFGKGLHNILEPLAFGVPVVFGPETGKYPEAALAMESEVARQIIDADGLLQALDVWLEPGAEWQIRARCTDFINWNSGATERVMKELQRL